MTHLPGGLTRRAFLGRAAGLTACAGGGLTLAACARPNVNPAAAAAPGRPRTADIGVQLYTVRDLMQRDPEGTLEQVAAIGYRRVELAGLAGRTPEQWRALLDRLGVTAPSAHVGAPLLRQNLDGQLRAARTLGHAYVTLPGMPELRGKGALADWRAAAAQLNRWGEACRAQGMRLAYHNHDWELRQTVDGGRSGYDVLLADADPALVDFQLDLYWAVHAGADPAAMFERHAGRFTMWHVKDLRVRGEVKEMTPVGEGTIAFAPLFARAGRWGLRHFFVEHDRAPDYPGGSLASIRASYNHLRRLLA